MGGNNFETLKKELGELLSGGLRLLTAWAVQYGQGQLSSAFTEERKKVFRSIDIVGDYQRWYSLALVVVKQLLPDRLAEFRDLYENPRSSKELTSENFRIANAMRGKVLTRYKDYERVEVAGMKSCLSLFNTQYLILKSAEDRFLKSLYDIQQLVRADLFDSEIDAARELNKKGFVRAAGAMAGVVLEKHLGGVLVAHNLKLSKKNPCINDLNQKLKDEEIIDVPTWRFIQRLGDLRNQCDHGKGVEPTAESVCELIDGVEKITKTLA